MKQWLIMACLIVVFSVPTGVWNKMPDTEKDRLLTVSIQEFCSNYAKQKNIHKFRIRLFQDKKRVMLDIVPEETHI